jgi:hypothetical protein
MIDVEAPANAPLHRIVAILWRLTQSKTTVDPWAEIPHRRSATPSPRSRRPSR